MTRRPVSMTILSLYLLVVFGLSLLGNLYGVMAGIAPYNRLEWIPLAIPKVLAFMAGWTLWRMLRMGAWLLASSVLAGWLLAVVLDTGLSPSPVVAIAVTLISTAIFILILKANWTELRPNRGTALAAGGASNA